MNFVGAHSMLNWNLEVLGKLTYPGKKNRRARAGEPTTNSTHIMVSMLYIKSVNTLNHNTTFASRSILLISNNSNWIGALGAKSLRGWKAWNTNPKELKGRLLFTGDTFFIFQNFTLKIKFIFVLKLINKSHNKIRHLHLSHIIHLVCP